MNLWAGQGSWSKDDTHITERKHVSFFKIKNKTMHTTGTWPLKLENKTSPEREIDKEDNTKLDKTKQSE